MVPARSVAAFVTSPPSSSSSNSHPSTSLLNTNAQNNKQKALHHQHHLPTRVGPLHAEQEKRPMIVIGNTNAALGAAMALCAQDVILQQESNNSQEFEKHATPIPPTQLITFFNQKQQKKIHLSAETVASLQNAIYSIQSQETKKSAIPSANEYQEILDSMDQDKHPILHITLDTIGGVEETTQSLSPNRNSLSFLGFNIQTTLADSDHGRLRLSRDDALEWGERLQNLLEECQIPVSVTMDMATHLAMLQANSLPKSRGLLGENDVFAIRDGIQYDTIIDNCDGALFEYQYDDKNSFGGRDPLICPSKGYLVPSPIVFNRRGNKSQMEAANDAYAAAYTAMRGSGMDPVSSICVATGVKAVFVELGNIDDDMFCPPSYTWNVIERMVEYSRKCRQDVAQEDGVSRKKYKEFGYL